MAGKWVVDSAVLVGKSIQGRVGRFPARILEITEEEARIQYFWYPKDAFYHQHKRFYANEVMSSSDTATVSLDQLLEPCVILFPKDYAANQVAGCEESNVFVCRSFYSHKDKTIRMFKQVKLPSLPPGMHLVPRAQPLDLVQRRPGEHDVTDSVTAIPIVFVADADIPVHIRDIVVVTPPPSPSDTRAASLGIFSTLSEAHSHDAALISDDSSTEPEESAPLPGRMLGRNLFSVGRSKAVKAKEVYVGPDGNEDYCGECRRPGNLLCCDGCPRAFHFGCVGVREETLGDQKWFCAVCQRTAAQALPSSPSLAPTPTVPATPASAPDSSAKKRPSRARERVVFRDVEEEENEAQDDDNDDYCGKCKRPGNLLCCDGCPRSFHFGCIGIREEELKDGEEWLCPVCSKAKKHQKKKKSAVEEIVHVDDVAEKEKEAHTPKRARIEPAEKRKEETSLSKGKAPSQRTEDFDEEPGEATGDPLQEAFVNADLYFSSLGPHRRKDTSDNTLTGLAASNIGPGELRSRMQGHDEAQITALQPRYQRQFAQWVSELLHGFNVLCVGIGSKRVVLREFAETVLVGSNVLVVNGFFAALSIKGVLNSITQDVLGYQGSFKNPIEQVKFIRDIFTVGKEASARQPLFLVIHSIDGPALRSEQAQTLLSLLAATPRVHIIASIDHINAPFMWDQARQSLFNWTVHDTTTFALYHEEITVTTKLTTAHNSSHVKAALAVLESQPPAARKALWILASMQLAGGPATKRGIRYADYLLMCQQQFAAHDDARLRKFLSEYRDHELATVRMSHGVELAAVTLERPLLQTLLDEMKAKYPGASWLVSIPILSHSLSLFAGDCPTLEQ
eukprot:m.80770 g.80770  ORF g.80770 m.80770 type:complete len:849 (-) comp13342_c0_seq1:23-2569(-)